MTRNINRNDRIISNLSELQNECNYEDFAYKDYFSLICKLQPNISKERLDIDILDEVKCLEKGFVYVFVVNGKIFKIGESTTNIKERIQSYNCGKQAYRENGTCSTTNYFVLQSFLALNVEVLVYAFFPQKPQYEIFGQHFEDSYPPTKKAENIIIEYFIQRYNKKPIGCTQR